MPSNIHTTFKALQVSDKSAGSRQNAKGGFVTKCILVSSCRPPITSTSILLERDVCSLCLGNGRIKIYYRHLQVQFQRTRFGEQFVSAAKDLMTGIQLVKIVCQVVTKHMPKMENRQSLISHWEGEKKHKEVPFVTWRTWYSRQKLWILTQPQLCGAGTIRGAGGLDFPITVLWKLFTSSNSTGEVRWSRSLYFEMCDR